MVAVFWPVLVFVSLQLENGLPNMSLYFLYLTFPIVGVVPNSNISWGDAFGWAIIPSSIGNTIGGFFLVSLVFSFAFETVENPFSCCGRMKKAKVEGGDENPSSDIVTGVIIDL